MNLKHSTNLIEELKNFGLNPIEWVLKPIDSQRFHIVNKKDQDWIFLGITRSRFYKKQWEKVQLISI